LIVNSVGRIRIPFAGPSLGVDIELAARWSDPADRLFTEAEHAYCLAQKNVSETYAGRWAAKEAVVKALRRWIPITPREIEIVNDAGGAPRVLVSTSTARSSDWAVSLSISHQGGIAVAAAIAEVVNEAHHRTQVREPPPPPIQQTE
jgi:holo-[acyl-carrier protein] synthase